jgi:hypothetical protein
VAFAAAGAVDVFDGSIRLFDKMQGVPIGRGVAASSALLGLDAPITIGDRRYMGTAPWRARISMPRRVTS